MDTTTVRSGNRFDTQTPEGRIIERGCVALETPDVTGDFLGLDSDGLESMFNTCMVVPGSAYDAP